MQHSKELTKKSTEKSTQATRLNRTKVVAGSDVHPNHSQEMVRLKRIKGQVTGIEKMIADRRYCPDIIVQIRAARAALQALEGSILKSHLRHCVKDAFGQNNSVQTDEKIQEIIDLLAK